MSLFGATKRDVRVLHHGRDIIRNEYPFPFTISKMPQPTVNLANDKVVPTMQIGGNGDEELKTHVSKMLTFFTGHGKGFGDAIGERLKITEVSLVPKAEEPAKMEGRVVCEITVADDMVNGGGQIHGGCSAYLVDLCSSLPLSALSFATGGSGIGGISQAINTVYHSPAEVGEPLRIVSTSLTIGARVMSARCEIWNVKHHRLVASGVHIKMDASKPKL